MKREEFINKAQNKYGNFYDYSKVVYVNNSTKICIICPIHGEFWIRPNDFLRNHICPKCAHENRKKKLSLTKEDFVSMANKKHQNKYDYSKVEYVNYETKVCIICPIHGEFWQTPHAHLTNKGCKKCGIESRAKKASLTKEEFVERANKIHNFKYDYSKVDYVNTSTKVCIICPKHGEFWQAPNDHLAKHGCSKCSGTKELTKEEFVERANKIHNFKYDYSKVEYRGFSKKICIICPIHGEFWQRASHHLNGHGCDKCAKGSITKEEFVERANKIHNFKYDYSKTIYINSETKVCIICPIHGEFWQRASSHLNGCGCPMCNESKLEKDIRLLLENNHIEYFYNKNYDFLNGLQLDFYIPSKKIGIECQGIQHFETIEHFGGIEGYNKRIQNDRIKLDLCKINNITIIYYSNLGISYPYNVYENKDEILKQLL